ncbi:hypothetical protein [Maribacter sp. R77961]|jgi:hypothetical protein|uniref:hypothetical protein n=1 Tax=Maribacter sp. R77961 TaxID=3093871 RepID=UPI0037C54569
MRKTFWLICFVLLLSSCKDAATGASELQDSGWSVDVSALPKKTSVNRKALAILKDWKAYNAFEANFDRLYKTEYREDFVLTLEELVESQKLWAKSNYPVPFDIPQIRGRQKVLKTYILKIKGDLEYRQDPETSIKEMIGAFNNLREHFNIVVNSNLPEDLFPNEKN